MAQDFNGDGQADLLVWPGHSTAARLFLSDGTDRLKPAGQFDDCLKALASHDDPTAGHVADLDLEIRPREVFGLLDVVLFGKDGHVLFNDGYGRFVLKASLWPEAGKRRAGPIALVDLTGDGLADVLRVVADGKKTLESLPTVLTPPVWLTAPLPSLPMSSVWAVSRPPLSS